MKLGHVHLKSLLDIKVLHVGLDLKRQISAALDLDQVSVTELGRDPREKRGHRLLDLGVETE